MTKKLAMLMLVLTCFISAVFAVPLNEGFEGTFPPTDWTNTTVTGHAWVQYNQFHTGAFAAGYAGTSAGGEGILMTPRLDLTAGTADAISFWYKQADWAGDQNELYVELSTDGGTNWIELAHLMNAEDFTQVTYNLETYTQTNNAYIRFRALDTWGYYTLIDDLTGPNLFAVDNDLQAFSITGNPTPTTGIAEVYTVTVRNPGNQSQSNYNVKLMAEGGTELASVPGTAIASGANVPFALSWTPSATGPMNIYGYVDFTADSAMENNSTAMYPINVQAAGTAVVSIGAGTETQYRNPYNLYYKSSLAQVVYPAAQITAGGLLTAVSFHANIVSTDIPANLPINIWMGETTQTTLAAFIPSAQLTQVFQGNVTFTAGDADYMFTLDTPYAYGGSNLVISVERPLDADYYSSSDIWFSTTCPSGEAVYYQSDTVAPDPTAPPTATAMTVKPNVMLYFATAGLGSITGSVMDNSSNPIAGAALNIVGENFNATSAADGSYSFPFVPAGTYSILVTKHGYADVQTDNIVVTEDMATTADFTMTMLPMVDLTGQILASDTAAGIMGHIELTGFENYSADTDASGFFTIPVFANQVYQGVASADGYVSAQFTATVGNTDLDLGTITVTEIAFPASNVVAEVVANNAQVTWNPAFQGGGGTGFATGFENEFPPNGWSVIITESTDEHHFQQFGTVAYTPPVVPSEGAFQTGVKWSYDEQDEWLITPEFACPGMAQLVFDFYGHYGSTNADHYEVKVSTNGGTNWTVLWDASLLPEGDNNYTAPVSIDLNAYAGQDIQIAWNFYDGPTNDGLWYSTFIDNVVVGSATERVQFASNDFTHMSKATSSTSTLNDSGRRYKNAFEPIHPIVTNHTERTLNDYTIYRLNFGDEGNMTLWTQLATITDTTYTDTNWSTLQSGTYEYAVVANYTNGVASTPAFSNWLANGMTGSLAVTVTTNVGTIPVGATVTITSQTTDPSGNYPTYTVMTDNMGVATFTGVWMATYDLTATLDGFAPGALTNIVIDGDVTASVMLTEVMIPANTVVAALNGAETEVNLTWNAPSGGGAGDEWIHKDSGENNDGIGLTSGGTFKVAVKFEADEIADYNGMYLSRINYFPNADATYILKVWTGDDGLTEVYSQAVANPVLAEWNEVQLTQAVTIDASVPLWIGYELTHAAGAYPAGTDAGPHVPGGDMIMMSSDTTWSELHVLAATLDYNWNIQGFVSWSPMARSIANHKVAVSPKEVGDSRVTYQLACSGVENQATTRVDRPVIGYNIYRLNTGQEGNPILWTMVDAFVTDLNAADTGWTSIAPGFYKWAVRAVYTGDVESPAAFSNELIKDMTGYIDGTVVDAATSAPIAGATVVINDQTIMTDATGYYMISLLEGVYTVSCSAPGYVSQTENNVAVAGTQVTTVNFALAGSAVIFEDGFESYTDFVIDFAPWTQNDVDGLATYGFTATTFENSGYTGSYIIFNPSMTTPALDLPTHGGDKFAACFAGIPAAPVTANNDWLITPQLHINDMGTVTFWARSYVADYGLERFKVGVSTTGTAVADFTFISGTNYIEAPIEWTEYSFDLNAYANQDIYIAIQCLSTDAFIFLLDDFSVDSPNAEEDNYMVPVVTELKGNYPNPFNPETTINYSVKNDGPVSLDIYNVRGQKVRTLVNDVQKSGNHTVVWNGTDNNGKVVSSGVYFYKMSAGNYNQTKKMMLMK
ncbi:MAG: choice-of-anchor J domain-containing protein [Candidatus Cloacimonetes bacterium]|nr:choice-of-anchor J domain-containing protein [Candidatus Cloacimonadota bacterium]